MEQSSVEKIFTLQNHALHPQYECRNSNSTTKMNSSKKIVDPTQRSMLLAKQLSGCPG
jgi:hypothetical protein